MPEPPVQGLFDAETLKDLDRTELARALSPLFEEAGPLVDALVGVHVGTWDEAIDAAARTIVAMDDATRAEVLRAHPRIGTPPAVLAERSPTSFREQGGFAATPDEVASRLEVLNDAYEARFGFPFVEWVAGRPKAAIVPVLEMRLKRDRTSELHAGTEALIAIARDRLTRLRSSAP